MRYDLEERTLGFAKACITMCRSLIKDPINKEIVIQLVRSSGSIGANYREANESLSRKYFFHRIGICRRESKESKYWLELLSHANQQDTVRIESLIDESMQLARIFAAISSKRN